MPTGHEATSGTLAIRWHRVASCALANQYDAAVWVAPRTYAALARRWWSARSGERGEVRGGLSRPVWRVQRLSTWQTRTLATRGCPSRGAREEVRGCRWCGPRPIHGGREGS